MRRHRMPEGRLTMYEFNISSGLFLFLLFLIVYIAGVIASYVMVVDVCESNVGIRYKTRRSVFYDCLFWPLAFARMFVIGTWR